MSDARVAASPSTAKLAAALAAVYCAWGSTYLAIRYAIETLPPFLMAGVRFLLAGAVLYVWAQRRGARRPSGSHWWSAAVVGGLLLVGGNGSVVWSEQRVASGLTALLVAMVPIWVVLLDKVWHGAAHPGRRAIVGLLLGFGGLVLLAGPTEFMGGERVDPLGVVVLMGGSISWAIGSIYYRVARLPESSTLATAMEMLTGGGLLTVAGLLTGEAGKMDFAAVSLTSLIAVLYLIVVGSLVGFNAYIWLLGATTPARATTYAYVNPVVALFLGWAVADEPITLRTLVAATIILTAVALIITDRRDRPADASGIESSTGAAAEMPTGV